MKRRVLWITIGVMVLLAAMATVAWAAPVGQDEATTQDALWVALAPLIAVATSIERLIEILWDRWERVNTWPNRGGVPDPSADEYISRKKMRSHWLGTLLAIIAIGLTNIRFFRLLGFDVLLSSNVLFDAGIGGIFDDFTFGTLIDWVMTAGIIGWGGTELTHNIIEGLVKGRGLWKEMQEVKEGQKSILDAKFFNDYIVPELEKKGISTTVLRQAFQTLSTMGVQVDELIGAMTAGKADEFLSQLEADPKKAEAARAVRTLLQGMPAQKQMEVPNVIGLLGPEQRKRFLGG